VDINSAWDMIRKNIKISEKESLGYYELKMHKLWFDEGYLKLVGQRRQAKLQWLQDRSEINGDNLNNVKYEASRHFRNKKEGKSERQNNELATNSKNRDLYRGINKFKMGYQPRSNLMKNENGHLLAHFHNNLNGRTVFSVIECA
jgi:hypothetical protein